MNPEVETIIAMQNRLEQVRFELAAWRYTAYTLALALLGGIGAVVWAGVKHG